METLRTELLRYFDQLDFDVHFTFMEVQQDTRKGTIHAMRVAMKRLRAFLQMWDEVDTHFNGKEAYNRLAPLFREAGRLRDLQIESALLLQEEEDLQLPHQTSDQVKVRIIDQERAFEAFKQAYSLADIREVSLQLRSHIEHMSLVRLRKGMQRYFRELLNDLASLSSEALTSKKKLHKLRKRIKEAYYNLIALDQATPHLQLPMELLRPLEALQHQLGRWHDHRITIDDSKNLWDVPISLKRQLREEENKLKLEMKDLLATLPPLTENLLKEMDALLKPVDQLTP